MRKSYLSYRLMRILRCQLSDPRRMVRKNYKYGRLYCSYFLYRRSDITEFRMFSRNIYKQSFNFFPLSSKHTMKNSQLFQRDNLVRLLKTFQFQLVCQVLSHLGLEHMSSSSGIRRSTTELASLLRLYVTWLVSLQDEYCLKVFE